MDEDFYRNNAEWYAALVAAWQEPTEAAIRALIGPLAGGDVVDIASGVGSSLPVLGSLGAGRLFAVEPSQAMRAGLMATIAGDAELLRRTTIVPAAFPDAAAVLPPRWSAAVMLNAIGHLDDAARAILWETLHERLVPGGRFLVSLQPPERAVAVPWTDFGEVAVGEHRITTRGQADPVDDTHVVWTMEWTLRNAAGAALTTRTATHLWRALSRDDLAGEAAGHGLSPVADGDGAAVLAFERC